MPEDIMKHLTYGEAKRVGQNELTCPLPRVSNNQPLLIIPEYNIIEMIEVAMEEGSHETLAEYVEYEKKQLQSMNKLDAFRQIAKNIFQYWDMPQEDKAVDNKMFDEIYDTFRKGWDEDLLDEVFKSSDDIQRPNYTREDWLRRHIEGDSLALALPFSENYLAPLWIPMGGFNECPMPLTQSAIFRDWHHQYGAVPILVTESSWALQAESIPQTDEEALALAREHFVFCPYVLETADSLGHYADYLKKQKIWYFWWD